MSKYIKFYDTLSGATGDESIVSPNLSYVYVSPSENKLLHMDNGTTDDPLKIVGDSVSGLSIQKKITIKHFRIAPKAYVTSEECISVPYEDWMTWKDFAQSEYNHGLMHYYNGGVHPTDEYESITYDGYYGDIFYWRLNYAGNNIVGITDNVNTDRFSADYDARITADGLISIQDFENNPMKGVRSWDCYLKGTLITLVDLSTKKVEDITYDDELLVWNFDEGKYDIAKPLWIKKGEEATQYYKCTLSNGRVLKLVGSNGNCHRIFSVTKSRFEYANQCVGDEIYTHDGIVVLEKVELINETVEFYNIITNVHMNVFANTILTSSGFNNRFPIKDMLFVKDNRPVREFSEFEEAGISRNWYDNFRLSEQTHSTEEIAAYIKKCESKMKEHDN